MSTHSDNFDRWIRGPFVEYNTRLEYLYCEQQDRADVMNRGAGLKAANGRTLMAPAEYIDPISCTATRTYRAPDFDRRETLEVTKIQDAWLVLNRTLPLLAEVLRTQYQTKGCQQDKAERLLIPVRQYKEEIKLARVWMSGQLAK